MVKDPGSEANDLNGMVKLKPRPVFGVRSIGALSHGMTHGQ